MKKICVLGLGYVGLPLLNALFKAKFNVIGYDIASNRVEELKSLYDSTGELSQEELSKIVESKVGAFTDSVEDIQDYDVYIVTVPTPITFDNRPDLTPIQKASEIVGKVLNTGNIVVYESTVYPGVTEEICVPILEEVSKLTFVKDFNVGYSPERINPGDKEHTIYNIVKIISGSSPDTECTLQEIYSAITSSGTYLAPSIRVAEAAKVIENTQRDINIALINELSIIFNLMQINTRDVLEAAATKWNFQKFSPGLVGGHCIGVDPYYLTYKSQQLGYNPEMILSGRKVNDQMPYYVVGKILEIANKKSSRKLNSILLMGMTFKANCPDTRNSKSYDLYSALTKVGYNVDCFDPWVKNSTSEEVQILGKVTKHDYDIIVIAVDHEIFRDMGLDNIKAFGLEDALIFDLKGILPRGDQAWSL